MYFYIILLSILFRLVYNNREELIKCYNDFRDLNNLVKTRHTGSFKIFYISLGMVAEMYYDAFCSYLKRTCNEYLNEGLGYALPDKNGNIYIKYKFNNRIYTIITKHKKGPNPINKILNYEDKDVTKEVLSYLGPNYDWHNNTQISPYDLKEKCIMIEKNNGETSEFYEDEPLPRI